MAHRSIDHTQLQLDVVSLMDVTFQGESNECGLACLQMVLGYHGRHLPLDELRKSSPRDQPLALDELVKLGASQGLASRALRCEPGDLSSLKLPAVLHVDLNHYVVLNKVSRRCLEVFDPANGRQTLGSHEIDTRFSGVALELWPDARFRKLGRRRRYSPLELFSQLPLLSIAPGMIGLILASLLVQGFALLTPFYLQVMVDEVLLPDNQNMAFLVTAVFAAVYLIASVTRWIQGLLAIQLGSHLSFSMSASLYGHITLLPDEYFQRRAAGDIVSRFASLGPFQEFLTVSLSQLLLDLLMITTVFVVVCIFSPALALFIVLVTGLHLVIQAMLLQPYRRLQQTYLVRSAGVQSRFIETLQTIGTARRYNARSRLLNNWTNRFASSLDAMVGASRWELSIDVCRYLAGGAGILGVVFLTGKDVAAGHLTLGMLYTLTAYAGHLTLATQSLSHIWQGYTLLAVHTQRLADMTETRPLRLRQPEPGSPVSRIEINNLSFGYRDTGMLYSDLSLEIAEGQKVAVTGTSGAGKSTLLKLVSGQLHPLAGEVAVDGIPLAPEMDTSTMFSSLMQDDQLIEASVMDNITFLDDQPDLKVMEHAAQLAGIHEEIQRLPMGYREQVSEHHKQLSAGQRQRLLLARVLYRQSVNRLSNLLILDEPTSHLDERTAAAVMKGILARPGACIFSTHSAQIAGLADGIVELSAGQELPTTARFPV